MKKHSILLAAVVLFTAAHISAQDPAAADRILRKVADKLARVKALGYKYTFHLSHPSQGRSIVDRSDAFVELRPPGGTAEFRFQFIGDERVAVYNGTEQFFLDKKGKKLHLQNNPTFTSFGNIALQNSPIALKYALPRIIADTTLAKKFSAVRPGGRDLYEIEIALPNRIINAAGELVDTRAEQTVILKIKVDRSTLLPVEVVQTNDKNDEVLTTTYAEITQTPVDPAPLSWYYSTFESEYSLQKNDDLTLIKSGATAPDINLARFGSDSRVTSGQFKGKLVLLEFWIAHCGFCISAVPKLNQINEKFRERGLEVVSINMYDPAAVIVAFRTRHRPVFTILTGGETIATQFGVDAYPAIVLVGEAGKVVYASNGLDEKELEAAITANLK